MILAHEAGLTLSKYVSAETASHIRSLRLAMSPQSMGQPVNMGRRTEASAGETPSPVEMRPPTRRALFEARGFHDVVARASRSLFVGGHFAQAVGRAFIATNNRVKRLSGLSQDGQGLMSAAFSDNGPQLRLSALASQSEIDEHKGLRFLSMGGMAALRNVPTHEDDWRWAEDMDRTLECLGLASLLNYLIDECETYSE